MIRAHTLPKRAARPEAVCQGGYSVSDLACLPAQWLPLFVFVAEMCVVTINTLRIIFVSRGMKVLAPLLGFFEVTTWLFAIGQVMQNLSDGTCFLAFAGGFTTGNFMGMLLEKRLALGSSIVRVFLRSDASGLVEGLRAANYRVTTLEGEGATGPVQVLYTVVKRREVDRVVTLIKRHEPKAFYIVDELQAVSDGLGPARKAVLVGLPLNPLRLLRTAR
jgi:uncharacterized protein YebE (UPF0316 family)